MIRRLIILTILAASLELPSMSAAPMSTAFLPPGATFDGIDATTCGAASPPELPAFPNHPGWPVGVQGGASPPVCADIDPSYPGLETVVGSLTSAANLYVFHQDGTLMSGYPVPTGFWIAASPSIADIDGDGFPEIVVGSFGSNEVWAFHANGTPLPGWPIAVGANVRSTAALADLDPTYHGLEVIVGVQDGSVQAWHADGTRVPGWPVQAGNFVERCAPAVGDVNGDGFLEVFVGSWYDCGATSTGGIYAFDRNGAPLPGWPKLTSTHTSVIASPALADLDGDGSLEIIVGTYETTGKMYVWHHDGSNMAGWPYSIPRGSSSTSYVSSSPAVADIDGDGQLEIVDGSCGQCGTVYAWKRDGTVVPGWPFVTNCVVDGSSPSIADVNGDGRMEIMVGSGSGFTPNGCTAGLISKMYILRPDGTALPGWPLDLGTATPPYPAVADVDGDGNVEIAVGFSQTVYLWDAPGALNPTLTPWPYYHLGIDHTGWFNARNPAAVDVVSPAVGSPLTAWPNPAMRASSIRITGGGPVQVLDAAGRVVRSLSGTAWDGLDAQGRRVPGGSYYIRGAGGRARIVIVQ